MYMCTCSLVPNFYVQCVMLETLRDEATDSDRHMVMLERRMGGGGGER